MMTGHHHPTQDQRGNADPAENDGLFALFTEASATLDLPLEVDRSRSTTGLAWTVEISGQFVIYRWGGVGGLLAGFLPRSSARMVQVNHVSSPFP
ncbi:hypothetical protein GGI1_11768 [Acidithiobacillus sp. GGI-221]|nr:hypothetical protein GGI1_11768 [Acidithiobacillus sp. GGI-221]